MEILIITDSGCEEAAALELARYLKAKPKVGLNVVSLQGSLDDAITLGFRMQTARRVLLQIVDPLALDDLEGATPDAAVLKLIPEDATFKVEGDVLAMTPDAEAAPSVMSQELVETVADWAFAHLNRKVKLSKPDAVIYAVQTPERLYVGLDIVGRSLAKREWRIMLSKRSLKSTVAAATILYAGAKENEAILDPFADDGSLVIEAALMLSATSARMHDRDMMFEKLVDRDWRAWKAEGRREIPKVIAFSSSLQEMKALRTNSKLAGVEKEIHATKVTVDWLDLKLEERSIDRIITSPIPSGKSIAPNTAAKLNDQLFNQAEYILKKGKTLTAITEKPDELVPAAQRYKFTETDRRNVLMGKRLMTIITFKK